MTDSTIQNFYDQNQFPGRYTMKELGYHFPDIRNSYLNIINAHISKQKNILDVGCGSGLISNLFGLKYPEIKFTAIDFASSVDYAESFAKVHNIHNVKYVKQDFLDFAATDQFDCIICQGVLHHIPSTQYAANKLGELLLPQGRLILGIYHPLGKILKKLVKLNYKNQVLYQDQECNPFELSITKKRVQYMFSNLHLIAQWPKNILMHAIIHPLTFSQSGGLVVYILQKSVQ